MPRGRPRKNPNDVLIKSAELIGWALGGIEREILETRQRLAALTAQAHQLRDAQVARARRGRSAAVGRAGRRRTAAVTDGRKRRRRDAPKRRRRK